MEWMHGVTLGIGGRIDSDRMHIVEFDWNDLDELNDIFKKFSDEIAAVILTPYYHGSFSPSIMPNSNFGIV